MLLKIPLWKRCGLIARNECAAPDSPFFGLRFVFGPRTFCLCQFSIKLICNAKRAIGRSRKKRRSPEMCTFLLGIFAEAEPNPNGKDVKYVSVWKLCGHNSYNAISSEAKMEKLTFDSALSCWVFSSLALSLYVQRIWAEWVKIINISKLPKTPIVSLLFRRIFLLVW